MDHNVIIPVAVVLLTALLVFEKKDSVTGKLVFKLPLSLLFIVTAAIQPVFNPGYRFHLLTGMVLCLGGDVLLIFPQKKAFTAGLISFLLGHIFYVTAFFTISSWSLTAVLPAGAVLVFSAGVFMRLRNSLGDSLIPVAFYIMVITAMVMAAGFVFFSRVLPEAGRTFVFAGAVLFYCSDLFVARNRFVKKSFFNRFAGLPMYYSGQFLLAFSAGMPG